ncbi:glycosyltransferase family 2 protein [Pseudoroseicyclus tamaricis]|uniref:Glycosyltransferase n=1 Tax=Pseudoroseicyclus tamaricis TaxID=2705421 RepID=A0A6B2JPB1_9RHOB|nr:glycosyltransferase family 2 protein [Pseudoroseicyclus tamaricis]NDV00537.1 glycosyltransferase [Pseudoroseicyclus tamaricis]
MPRASIIVPAYNCETTLHETLEGLCAQTYGDFEIVVVDDGSTDRTAAVARSLGDARIRLIQQPNRGLAGARNSGIAHARGAFLGFCDADDLWRPTKLAAHVAHLEANPNVGISYSGSELIDAAGKPLRIAQRPRLTEVSAAHIFLRNPIGNGSAPVIRRAALDDIAFACPGEPERTCWFDESFRQSEDVECWLRFKLTTDWDVEGIPGLLTRYRIVASGLSAGTARQFATWERLVAKLTPIAPEFMARHTPTARAYMQRYLARRAISSGDGQEALARVRASLAASRRPLWQEPAKSATTIAAAAVLYALGAARLPLLRRPAGA